MSGQLNDADKELLDEAYKDFSSGKRERDIPSSPTAQERDKKAEAPNDAPRPDKPSQPAEDGAASAAGKSDGKAAGKSDKPRDETGKFAPAPEPFEGFNDLDPKIQRQFKNLKQERDKFQNDYKAVEGRLQPLQREYQRLQQQLEAPKQTSIQGQKKVDDFLTSDEFKDFADRYPQDALGIKKGLQETVDQLRSEVADSSKPLAEKLTQVEAKLGEYERERKDAAARKEMDRLSEIVPNWKLIAGWERETEDGQIEPVHDRSQHVWHPWFAKWLEGLPHVARQAYDRMLQEASADSIGHVFSLFQRDVEAYQRANGQTVDDASGQSEVQERRSEALRDISPRPSRSGADTPIPTFNGSGGADDRAAVIAHFYPDFKAGRKLR
jgi:hypothetical protein